MPTGETDTTLTFPDVTTIRYENDSTVQVILVLQYSETTLMINLSV